MRLTLILASLLPLTMAFAPVANQRSTPFTALQMSTESVQYVITGNNIDMTPSLNDYVEKKLDRIIGKLSSSGAVQECDVHLSVNKNPKVKEAHKAEVVTYLKGTVIRCAEETPDMYASIDAVTDRLAKKLKQYKERRLDGYHGGPNMGENLATVLEELSTDVEEESSAAEPEFVDPEAPVVTKIKSYDLSTPISVEEAIFALGYVDHDFYVFRESESNEVTVVYKRNAGGYGLIAPQQD
jgi:putative sigma-54 modulation protein